ncbi:sensor histidine kinase [Sporosarcina sp. JAI121]|uniref:sensor histidine kinase n=1 Tax=Sporosarcina sp. JAI121 TaxID=2723064 RepID=UPI0015CD5A46|nr:ATP-binding protein [Sporosarcina sp. JAI121]NYF23613.1 signal transduction histidine kinase [Sporosarcina sp. JAI121]
MLIKEITTYIIECTQGDEAFFWLTDVNHKNSHLASSMNKVSLEAALIKEWTNIRGKDGLFVDELNGDWFGMRVIRTSRNIGVLGVKISDTSEARKAFLLNRLFDFLAELSEIMLERIYNNQMREQMILIEEQNRIANEIHDSVSQRLFGIVCALHSLQVKSTVMTNDELNDEYLFLSESANTTLKELRAAIYRLSSMKKGSEPFFDRLKKYLGEFARLHGIRVDYQLTGDEVLISEELKHALYRIVCEACGNAVRHGQCTAIELRLSLADGQTVLEIKDNGIGFNLYDYDDKKENGIGLFNMQSIASSFIGTFSIGGLPGLGTEIRVEIPNLKMLEKEEAVG